jgi:hypothetical protein
MNEKMNEATINYLQKVSLAARAHNEVVKRRIKVSLGRLPTRLVRCRNFGLLIILISFIFAAFLLANKISLYYEWPLLALVILWGVASFVMATKIDNIKHGELVKYLDENSDYLQMIEFLRRVGGETSEFGYGFYKYL